MIWKSKGDGEKRKYDFDYDAVNRITGAAFNQYVSGSGISAIFNKTAGVDFSMKMGDGINATSAYDANGNFKAMTQTGLKINASSEIDNLAYTYQNNSNKLLKVTDAANDKDSKLGDFKYDPATKGTSDYSYDANGNLISDANKKITSITYNYLNLPSVITVTGKGTITYTYDATGNKLKKVTVDNTTSPSKTTTTLYIDGVVYENDMLQFVGHEEGRIRFKPAEGAVLASFAYDYFLKDHLGNVRMVLTEETKSDQYPPASMETAQATTEEALYANVNTTRSDKPSGYPTDNYTTPNDKLAKTNGNGNKIGPSIILKVMSGDKFNIRVSSWYKKNGATPQSPNSIATDLVTGLINSLTGTGGPIHGAITSAQLTSSGVIPISTTSFLNSQPAPGSTKPKAYINWVLLDEQFKFVSTGSGAEQVGNDNTFTVHVKNDMPVTKSGYLYVFVSNETPNIDVYFDNLQITHTRGPILEETHYYPGGLTMAGISSKALQFGEPENKKKYNGIEFESNLGLNVYDAQFRELDAQTGRWWQIDPVTEGYEHFSPYASMYNNPIRISDPLGDEGDDCCWDKIKAVGNYVAGTVVGAVVGTVDNLTGSNIRGQVSSSFSGTGAAGYGWNSGLNVADAGGMVVGMLEIVSGGAGIIGGGTATLVTAGTGAPVTVPVVTGSAALATHGIFNLSNSTGNLVNQNGRVDATSKQTGSYTNTHKSGKTYSGKGSESRSKESGNRVGKQNNDPIRKTEWKPSKNAREVFKAEDKRIQKNGGAGNTKKNYNKINSPGKKYNEQDKQ